MPVWVSIATCTANSHNHIPPTVMLTATFTIHILIHSSTASLGRNSASLVQEHFKKSWMQGVAPCYIRPTGESSYVAPLTSIFCSHCACKVHLLCRSLSAVHFHFIEVEVEVRRCRSTLFQRTKDYVISFFVSSNTSRQRK